jgi:hypothetical protein
LQRRVLGRDSQPAQRAGLVGDRGGDEGANVGVRLQPVEAGRNSKIDAECAFIGNRVSRSAPANHGDCQRGTGHKIIAKTLLQLPLVLLEKLANAKRSLDGVLS